MSANVVVEAEGVSKRFSRGLSKAVRHSSSDIARELLWWRDPRAGLRSGEFWALRDVSFTLTKGDALGIIGPNGAGKSTLLKMVSGLLRPDQGRIAVRGRLRAMIELGAAFNPVLSGRENIFAQGSLYGYHRSDLVRQLDAIVEFAGIAEFIDAPVQQYSDGMRARLGFAVAMHLDPDILLVDEVLAVGDLAFQNKCIHHIRHYLNAGGSLVFVGHATHQVQSVCRSGLVLEAGRATFQGGVVEALDYYLQSQRTAVEVQSHARANSGASDAPSAVRIASVESRPGNGASSLATGGSLDVTIICQSTQPLAQVSVALTIFSRDGTRAIAGARVSPPVPINVGVNHLGVSVPRITLIPGTYLLRVALVDTTVNYPVALFGWDEKAHPLKIEGQAHEYVNSSVMAGIEVLLVAKWSVPVER